MPSQPYPVPDGAYAVPDELLDLRPDSEVDQDLLYPRPVSDEKNIWFFWHQGFAEMHPYSQRTVRAWHRRFSKKGWVVRVVDTNPSSSLNVANFLDVKDPGTFPQSFINGSMGGDYARQHTSDFVRWPLLLKYGGVYADVGLIQIGDLDRLWTETVGNPESPYEMVAYNFGGEEERSLGNYFYATQKNNPLFLRSHKLFLELWAADGGKTHSEGMHTSPLLVPLTNTNFGIGFEEDGKVFSPEDVGKMLADYMIQVQAMKMVMGLLDEDDGWNGPKYCADHVFAINYLDASQLINVMTEWNGPRQFELMSLPLPRQGEAESEDQKLAREIVEACLNKSFSFKLAHGLIIRVMGDTLGVLWRRYDGSDNVPETYAQWLRHGTLYWNQKELPTKLEFREVTPIKKGPLLGGV